jgi:hypothetical protein
MVSFIIPPLPPLEKDQYEMIRRLRLIVYHHNLHLWYRVVYRYYWKFYLGGINEIYDFFISIWWYGQIVFHNSNINFHFNFENEIFQNFHFKFSWHISIFFHFPLVVWPIFFQISVKFQNQNFLQYSHFHLVVWPFFFQNSKTKIFNSNFKNEKFSKFSFQSLLVA